MLYPVVSVPPPRVALRLLVFVAIYNTFASDQSFRRDQMVGRSTFPCKTQYFWTLEWSLGPQSPLGPRRPQMTPNGPSNDRPNDQIYIMTLWNLDHTFTPQNLHHEIYTTKCTPRSLHHEIYTTNITPQMLHYEIYTTKFTSRNLHHEVYTTKFTPQILHHTIYTANDTSRYLHHKIYTMDIIDFTAVWGLTLGSL